MIRRTALSLFWAGWAWAAAPPAATWKDDMGREVRLPPAARRVVSLSPSVTECLAALEAWDRVAGITDHCPSPPAGLTLSRVGGSMTPSAERIVALHPDLVVGDMSTTIPRERVEALERAGVPVVMFRMRTLADMLERLERLGSWMEAAPKARRLSQALSRRIQAVEKAVEGRPRPSVLFVVWADPLWTIGRQSLVHDLLTRAGGANLAGGVDRPGVRFSTEEVVQKGVDVLVFSQHPAERPVDTATMIPDSWKSLTAVKKGRVHRLTDDAALRASPRSVDALESLARLLHPEVFFGPVRPGGK